MLHMVSVPISAETHIKLFENVDQSFGRTFAL
jgi:hypothetical protein